MYLLDTNALIILLHEALANGKLKEETKSIMLNEDKLFVSIVSLWEIAIKVKIGKLGYTGTIEELQEGCYKQGVEIVPIKADHLDKTLKLPWFDDHKDPFDRLIIAVGITEGMTVISTDNKIRRQEYLNEGLKVLW